MSIQKYTFSKNERLCSRSEILLVVQSRLSAFIYPWVIKCHVSDTSEVERPYVQIAITVAKKRYKRAVDRNRIKRIGRELYRLNKSPLIEYFESKQIYVSILMSYIGNEMPDFHALKPKFEKLMAQTIAKIESR